MENQTSKNLILGSGSLRRREILDFFSLPFTQVTPNFDENSIPFEDNPSDYALLLSEKKSMLLSPKYPNQLILTADTVVYYDKKIYNKPEDAKEAFQFLSDLSGKWHSVYTGLTLVRGEEKVQGVEETKVLFQPLTPEYIHLYLQHVNFRDKAGGYAIQRSGSIAISRIEGCYYNVMGMPVGTLRSLLMKMGVDLWQHLKNF